MAAVQFFGREAIVKAYTARGGTWGLFQGKELIAAGGDSAALNGFLCDMYQGSTAEYKLRFYPDVESEDIEPSTPHNSQYTFKLCEPGGYSQMAVGRIGTPPADPIMQGIQEYLYKKVGAVVKKELEGGGEQEDEQESVGDIIMGYIKDPVRLNSVIETIGRVFGRGAVGMQANLAAVGTVAPGVQRVTGTAQKPATQEELLAKYGRVEAAFDRLEKCDPDFLNTFERLANLAETNPSMYNMAKKML